MGFNVIPFHDTFDNLFPYTTAIANRFSSVVPYAIGADGERMDPQPAALQALYTPNSPKHPHATVSGHSRMDPFGRHHRSRRRHQAGQHRRLHVPPTRFS